LSAPAAADPLPPSWPAPASPCDPADLSAGAGPGGRAATATATDVRDRAARTTGRPSARTGIAAEGRAAATTADEHDLGTEQDGGPATAGACAQGGGGVGRSAVPAPAEAEAALCRFHSRPVSAGSLALAADDDDVDRSGRHGDRRLRPATESRRDVTQPTSGRAFDDERRLVDAGRDRPGLLTAGAGEGVGHPGCLSHADGG
jgi:hypothetical protein